jgi:transglutaminase-like putative cysteine protease
MTSRVRPLDALLAALATIAVLLPATTLFTSSSWVQPAVVVVAVVAAIGCLARWARFRALGVMLAQLLAGVLALGAIHGQGHLFHGLPTLETARAFGILLHSALQTVLAYTAPAPTNRGIALALGILAALTALVVDAIAVTRQAPAAAGLPLLAAYIAVAANSGDGLPVAYFLFAAATWLALLGRHGVAAMRRWSTAVTRSADEGSPVDPTPGFASVGRAVGLGALAVAVVLTAAVPHLPTTFVAQGLGHAAGARGAGSGGVTLNSTLDISRSLGDRSQQPVLTYTTTSTRGEPLRVDVLEDYENGSWTKGQSERSGLAPNLLPLDVAEDVARKRFRMTVDENRMKPPQVALPLLPVDVSLPERTWATDSTGTVRLERAASSYAADFFELEPKAEQFSQGSSATLSPSARSIAGVTGSLAERLDRLAEEIVPSNAKPLEAARAIQAYFRSGRFAYSLELAEPTDAISRGELLDPLSAFFETRQGYCVQFATAMIMLSRTIGIPARMAIGFLPGRIEDGHHVVRAADAHAWPELYFTGLGWVRFEPTPGSRSGAPPAYSLADAPSTGTTTPTPGATSTAAPVPSQRPDTERGVTQQEATGGSTASPLIWLQDNWQVLLVLLAGILGTLVLPIGAWVRRVRARRQARDEAARIEADWAALLSRLGDLGVVPPEGATPRQSGQFVVRDAYLDQSAAAAMTRVVTGVERARYADPESSVAPVRDDARAVWQAASGVRRPRDRVRAAMLPGDGRRFWREVSDGLAQAPRHLLDRVRGRRPGTGSEEDPRNE